MLWEFVFCWSLQASGTWMGISFSNLKKFSSMNLLKMSSMPSWWCLFSFYAHNQKLMSFHGVTVLFMVSHFSVHTSSKIVFTEWSNSSALSSTPNSVFPHNPSYWRGFPMKFFLLGLNFLFPTASQFGFYSAILSLFLFLELTAFYSSLCFVFMEYIHVLYELFEHTYNNSFEFFLAFQVISLCGCHY